MTSTRCISRRAFTIVELLIAVSILGILALAVMPSFNSDAPLRLVAACNIITSDIEYAQAATLADPAEPLLFVMDADQQVYWLARSSTPETPITRPDNGEPYLVAFNQPDDLLQGVTFTPLGFEDPGVVRFDPFGRLEQLEGLAVRVTNETGDLYVSVTATTGSVAIETEW